MKKITLILFVLLTLVLSGCNVAVEETPEKSLLSDSILIGINDEVLLDLPVEFEGLELSDLEINNSNPGVVLLLEDVLLGFDKGVSIITIESDDYKLELEVTVYSVTEYKEGLLEISTYIKKKMATVGDEFFEIVEEIEDYDFDITYIAQEPDVLDLNGHYTRGLVDKFTTIEATINYMGIESKFYITVKIEMIPAEEQKETIEGFIEEEIKDIIAMEDGMLPTKFDVYGLDIVWSANLPGVIGFNNSLNPAYNSENVTLYAKYRLGREDEIMEVKYISKGVSESEKANYINRVLGQLIPDVSTKWVNTIYGNEEEIIQDFIYPDSNTRLRPGTGKTGTKMPGGPQYVVIHDTGMSGPGDTAEGLNGFIHGNANSDDGRVASWHFSIDDKETYQHVPTDEIAWHAGDGGAAFGSEYFNKDYNAWSIGGGNQNGIGIETCINAGGNYELTLKRTAKLTAALLHQYNLTLDRVKTHNDFSGKNCPAVIRSQKGLWESFMRDVEIEYFLLTIGDDITVNWENSNPEIIKSSGLVVKPIHDTNVKLTLNIVIDEQNYRFDYTTLVKGLETSEKLTKVYYDLLVKHIPNTISSSLDLPTRNEQYGADIVWTSDNESVLSSAGVYSKPENETIVKMTCVIKIGEEQLTKVFNIKVN